MAAIERLPSETRAQLRSTQIITSLPQLVSELVQNALDAGAGQVEVGVDCAGWACWVRDDGGGIGREGMGVLLGGGGGGSAGRGDKGEREGGRYATSKAYALESLDGLATFGFRGEGARSALVLKT